MNCPFCGEPGTRVLESRDTRDGRTIRRRRVCVGCERRFTTYENVEMPEIIVVKRDGRRERFNPAKLRDKLYVSLTKRPVPTEEVHRIVRETETELQDSGVTEVPSTVIGELVLEKLKALDTVAYIRFASVYREFRDLDDWRREMASLEIAPDEPEY